MAPSLPKLLAEARDADDEGIDDEGAFNSDDKIYGGRLSRGMNLSLSIPLCREEAVRVADVAGGGRMVFSSACLDVPSCDFHQVKLMFRCVRTGESADGWACLCNYLSAERGGMGLMPSALVNLEVIGPCMVEFRAVVTPHVFDDGCVNVFGIVWASGFLRCAGADNLAQVKEHLPRNDAVAESPSESVGRKGSAVGTGRKRKLDEDVKKAIYKQQPASESEHDNPSESKQSLTEPVLSINEKITNRETSKRQRNGTAHEQAKQLEETPSSSRGQVVEGDTPSDKLQTESKRTNEARSNPKLSKKQRRKLAREKSKQLHETLSAARNNNMNDDDENKAYGKAAKEKPKKNKKRSSSPEGGANVSQPPSRPTSLTRERRLAGGLVVSDVLVGTGAPVRPGRRVAIHYTGTLRSTGKVFDRNLSRQHPLVFRQGTGEVIRGMERGLEGMRAGGERVVVIPSALGYGSKGAGADIPPDSDLVFEVKVLKVG